MSPLDLLAAFVLAATLTPVAVLAWQAITDN